MRPASSRPRRSARASARSLRRASCPALLAALLEPLLGAQARKAPPLRQSARTTWVEDPVPLTLRDASREDR